jgi:MYXO-CTERM domain-containing protein
MRVLFGALLALAPLVARAQPCAPHLYGINIDPSNPAGAPSAAELRAAGAKWARFVFKVEGDDLEAAFARYDPVLADFAANDIWSLVVINYESLSAKPDFFAGDEAWRAYLDRFELVASAVAARYGFFIPAFEIWNEPDEPNARPEYDPRVPAHIFGEMMMRSYLAVRGAGSFAQVITGGADSGDPFYLAEAGAHTGGLWADGVGLHPYGQRAPDNYPSPDWGFGNYTDIVSRYFAVTGLPVWVTEIGTEEQDFQADYLFQIYATTRAFFPESVAPHVFWFAWSDGMVPPFGLLDAAGDPKDSYFTYVNETAWGNAGCGAGLVPGEGPGGSGGSGGGVTGGCAVSPPAPSGPAPLALLALSLLGLALALRRR